MMNANPMSDVFSFKDDKESLTLRYDMSAPLARFVAQNYRDLTFPYKRYTYGDVFRREKPDSARYRSFMQFDADIIGNVMKHKQMQKFVILLLIHF